MGDKVISRHGSEMLTAKVVKMRYSRDVQYLGYKIWSNYDTCTSKCRNYNPEHGFLTERFSSLSPNDIGQHSVEEI